MKRFTIVATYYQNAVTDEELDRFMTSIEAQTFKDFELLLIHDGKLLRPCKYPCIETKERKNMWGHNLRDIGIQRAQGEYILHTNADNVYTKNALEVLNDEIEPEYGVYTMHCAMMGLNNDEKLGKVWYDIPRDYSKCTVLKGYPKMGAIDLMQVCISKEVWDNAGGWSITSETSDGILIESICNIYPYKMIDALIGWHY